MNYTELNRLPAKSLMSPVDFRTDFDQYPENVKTNLAVRQYQKGLEIGQQAKHVFITAGTTWGSVNKNGSQTSSYEGIGYHAGTAYLLHGFLDSGVPIYVYREYRKSEIITEKREIIPMPDRD